MTKIRELKKLMEQMQTITSEQEYIDYVGLMSDWDCEIVDAIESLYKALNKYDEKYYLPPTD